LMDPEVDQHTMKKHDGKVCFYYCTYILYTCTNHRTVNSCIYNILNQHSSIGLGNDAMALNAICHQMLNMFKNAFPMFDFFQI
jgi:hypothetical protein